MSPFDRPTSRTRVCVAAVTIALTAFVLTPIAASEFAPAGGPPVMNERTAGGSTTASMPSRSSPQTAPVYNVTFNTTSLPAANTWFVRLGPPDQILNNTTSPTYATSAYGQLSFSEPNGTYNFSVADSQCDFAASPAMGTLVVNGTNVGVFVHFHLAACVPVSFKAVGLGSSLVWSAEVTWPEAMAGTSPVTSNGSGPIVVELANGTVTFEIGPPAGYAVAKVTGPSSPTFSTANISGPTLVVIHFGALENVTFAGRVASRLPDLPSVGEWSVTLTPRGPGTNPEILTNSTTGPNLSFLLPHGARFNLNIEVDTPSYWASPSHGSLGVPGHALVRPVHFHPVTQRVVFVNMVHGTPAPLLCANLTGPVNVSSCTTRYSIPFRLVNGTYNFSIFFSGSIVLTPASGNFTTDGSASTLYIVLQALLPLQPLG